MRRAVRTTVWNLGLILMVLSNATCRVIPIQAGRVDMLFSYALRYELGGLRERDSSERLRGGRLLAASLGESNYCSLCGTSLEAYAHKLFEGGDRWQALGTATAVISPSPWKADGFIFEGHGRYLIQSEYEGIATADFVIEKQSVSDVRTLLGGRGAEPGGEYALRWIDLLVRQRVFREAALHDTAPRFVHPSWIVLRMYLVPLDPDGVLAIAPVKHEVGLVSPLDSSKVYSVGCLELDEPRDGRKIIDVRKRDSVFRVKDYPELLRKAGIQELSNTFSPRWYGRPCAADEQRPPYRAGAERSARDWIRDPEGKIFEGMFPAPNCANRPAQETWCATGPEQAPAGTGPRS